MNQKNVVCLQKMREIKIMKKEMKIIERKMEVQKREI